MTAAYAAPAETLAGASVLSPDTLVQAVSSAVTTPAPAAFPTYRDRRSSPAAANAATTTTANQPARLALDRGSDSCPRLDHPVPGLTAEGCFRRSQAGARAAVGLGRPYLEATACVVLVVSGSRGRGLTRRGPSDIGSTSGDIDSSPCDLRSHRHLTAPSAATRGRPPTVTGGRCTSTSRTSSSVCARSVTSASSGDG